MLEKAPELPPLVTARCWAVYDAQSMKYLDGKNPYTSREVASLTKVMTFYTTLKVFERLGIDDFDGVHFKVTRYATSMNGTSARLRSGTWITLKDLFYALMLPSGNDAAIVLAENVGTVLILAKNRTEDLRELLTAEKRDLFFEELMQ
jgi:D-alanyl-D-alanine carboxypeptidase